MFCQTSLRFQLLMLEIIGSPLLPTLENRMTYFMANINCDCVMYYVAWMQSLINLVNKFRPTLDVDCPL